MVCQKCAKSRKHVSPGNVYKVDPPGNMAQKLKMHHVLMCTGIIFGNKKKEEEKIEHLAMLLTLAICRLRKVILLPFGANYSIIASEWNQSRPTKETMEAAPLA